MTLKQRRRHSELIDRFEAIKKSPYINVPEGYEVGANPEEDEKYRSIMEELNDVIREIHEIEETARAGN